MKRKTMWHYVQYASDIGLILIFHVNPCHAIQPFTLSSHKQAAFFVLYNPQPVFLHSLKPKEDILNWPNKGIQ